MDWSRLLDFALLGLGPGALIAGIALGIVLTFRGSGIINLATGAIAMVAGYAFWSLKSGSFGVRLASAPALVLTTVVVLALGVLIELGAFRPLRASPPLAKLASSLGILLVAQAAVVIGFGTDARQGPSILPDNTVAIYGITFPVNRFVLAAIVVSIAALLSAVYRWSRFGLATRAAAESEVSAMLAGLSPDRLSMASTLLACLVSGALGVLAASLISLDSTSLPLQVVPALAAALIGRFTSFGIACAAGLAIGITQSILDYVSLRPPGFEWFPQQHGLAVPGLKELLVFAVIVAAMFWRGSSLPGRGEVVEKRLPAVPRPERMLRPAVLGSTTGVIALIALPFDYRQALINSLIAALICLSLVVITGFVGQISLVQLALAGVSGFVLSHLATDHGVPFPFAPLAGATAATALGLAMAVSALRVRGVSLSIVTLAAAVAIERFGFDNAIWGGGATGSPVPELGVLGADFGWRVSWGGLDGKEPSPVFGFVVLGVLVALCLLVANLRRSSLGQRMLAVRSNERAAAAVGIDVRNVKLTAFGLASFIAGIAGALYGYNFGSVSAQQFSAFTALGLVAFAYVGGITVVSGAILAGLISTQALVPYLFEDKLGISGNYALLFGGLALIANLVVYPEGIAGGSRRRRRSAFPA